MGEQQMAYDRYDRNDARWRDRDDRHGGRDERGFFERAGDEVASWFGDDEAGRRRREDQRYGERERGSDRDRDWRRDNDRGGFFGRDDEMSRGRSDRDSDRGWSGRSSYRGYGGEGPYRSSSWNSDAPGTERGYQPMFGGYTASQSQSDSDNRWRGDRSFGRGRDFGEGRRSEFGSLHDPHYESWRRRQLEELDRDYDDYRREHQARFESEFGSWRERRMQKRGLLGQIREHMEVVGNDDEHIGTIDRVTGDRIILAKSDPDSGGVHHSLSCSDIERVEGDRVILDCSGEQARNRWRDESRSRALFEREDQGEMGDRVLDRSFSGTYR
jgi:hypothetical protein